MQNPPLAWLYTAPCFRGIPQEQEPRALGCDGAYRARFCASPEKDTRGPITRAVDHRESWMIGVAEAVYDGNAAVVAREHARRELEVLGVFEGLELVPADGV